MDKQQYKTIQALTDTSIIIDDVCLSRVRQIGHGKSGKVYLYEGEGLSYAVKLYQYETDDPMINYIPLEEILDFELKSYEQLTKLDIPVAPLIAYDTSLQVLVKEYIEGENIIDLIAADRITKQLLELVFGISACAAASGLNIDYFPANFIFDGSRLWYVDYECNPFEEEWSFESWGIYYWLNPSGMQQFLETKNGDFINKPGTVKPYDEGEIMYKRDELIERYINSSKSSM